MSVAVPLLAAAKPRLAGLPAALVCLLFVASVCGVWRNDMARLPGSGASGSSSFASDGWLRFGSDGTFRILQMTDLHYGESESQDAQSNAVRPGGGGSCMAHATRLGGMLCLTGAASCAQRHAQTPPHAGPPFRAGSCPGLRLCAYSLWQCHLRHRRSCSPHAAGRLMHAFSGPPDCAVPAGRAVC